MKAEKEKVEQPKQVKVKEYLRYEFTEEELRERAKDLALSVQKQTRAQEEQKAAQAQFKQRIEFEISRIGALSTNISMGWEMRDINCMVTYHVPAVGTKRITRLDTGELVRDQAMSSFELQEQLFPNAEEDAT